MLHIYIYYMHLTHLVAPSGGGELWGTPFDGRSPEKAAYFSENPGLPEQDPVRGM